MSLSLLNVELRHNMDTGPGYSYLNLWVFSITHVISGSAAGHIYFFTCIHRLKPVIIWVTCRHLPLAVDGEIGEVSSHMSDSRVMNRHCYPGSVAGAPMSETVKAMVTMTVSASAGATRYQRHGYDGYR